MTIEAFPSNVDPEMKAKIKTFILTVTNELRASLPSSFSLWADGMSKRVVQGSPLITYDYIYIGDRGNNDGMLEVATLSAMATLFRLEEDEEVKNALQTYLNKTILDLVTLRGWPSVTTLNGLQITTLAIKGSQIAALVGDSYHLENGEKAEVNDEWTIFPLTS